MATHSSTLAWKISWTEEPDRLQFMVSCSWTRLNRLSSSSSSKSNLSPALTLWLPLLLPGGERSVNLRAHMIRFGEGIGTPLQYSWLENPMDEGAWWAIVHGLCRVGHNWATSLSLFTLCTGEGNGNPLQCSCLENPRDRGVWWAAIYGVAQSQTRLKQLSSSSSNSMIRLDPPGYLPIFMSAG